MVDSFHVNFANILQDSGENIATLSENLQYSGVKMPIPRINFKCSQCTEREGLSGTCDTKFNFLLIFRVLCLVSLVLTFCLAGSILLDGCSFSQFNNKNCEKHRLKQIKFKNPNKLLVGHLNVDSYRNKMDLQHFFDGNTDIFLLSETKLDVSFPNAQFYIKGYS